MNAHITAHEVLNTIPGRFRKEKAMGIDMVFHFDIMGAQPIRYTVSIAGGICSVQPGLHGKPGCVVTADEQTYVALETGQLNPQQALLGGAVQVTDLNAMLQFVRCFKKFNAAVPESQASPAYLTRSIKTGPLQGIRILDFTRLLPGPLATMLLADIGAEVIKIEDPDNPDYIRSFEPQLHGQSAFYMALNRGKKSLALNYLSEEGRQVLYKLVAQADVLVEQFRPGVMESIGLGYEKMSSINPRLIYVSVSGYGQQSTRAAQAGHDLNYIAVAGLLGVTGTAGKAVIPGFQVADVAGGGYMAMHAVTTALYQREKTGAGQWLDISMTDAVVPLMALPLAEIQAVHADKGRGNYDLSGGLPNYNTYRCSDGRHLAVGSLEPKFWNKLCTVIGKPEWSQVLLAGPGQQQKLKQELEAILLQKTRAQWLESFAAADCCVTPVNDLGEVLQDEYLNSRKLFIENQHDSVRNFNTVRHPVSFKNCNFGDTWDAPVLGEDTAQLLKQGGFTEEEISTLMVNKVLKN
jgi:alpha-methylacyl-CoA racemase